MNANLDQRTVKKSFKRLVISGNTIEQYFYEKPYFYNWGGRKADSFHSCRPKAEKRRDDNLFIARRKIRRLINANQGQYGERTKFITYTFKENITDLKTAHKYWGEYCKKLKYRFGNIKYIAVVEFQKRGAIHYHVVYFSLPYIQNVKDVLAKLWGQGFINVKTLREVRNIGAYVCKYLQKDVMDSRLVGEKVYFGSRELIKPFEIKKEENIAEFLLNGTIDKLLEKEYRSQAYGKIIYQQGLFNKFT